MHELYRFRVSRSADTDKFFGGSRGALHRAVRIPRCYQ
jgi:hypothetical protein